MPPSANLCLLAGLGSHYIRAMARWLIVLVFACCGPAKQAEAPRAAPTCRDAITKSATLMRMSASIEPTVGMCERQQWSVDMRSCIAKATQQADLGECGKLLPPVSTNEIDQISVRSLDAVKQLEVYADELCTCTTLECAGSIVEAAAKFAQALPPIIPAHHERSKVAEERFTSCAKRLTSR